MTEGTERKRRPPCVDLRTDVFKDMRFEVLGELAGLADREHAIGKISALWAWCIDRKLRDAPADCDGYAVSPKVAERFLGPNAQAALLADGCDELALGELRPDGLIYLRGTSERVAGLRQLAAVASAGGRARAASDRGSRGRFVGENTIDQPASSRHPAGCQPSDQPDASRATSRDQRSSSSSSSEDSPPARARAREEQESDHGVVDPLTTHSSHVGRIYHGVLAAGIQRTNELAARGLDPAFKRWTAQLSSAASAELRARIRHLLDQPGATEDGVRAEVLGVLEIRCREAEERARTKLPQPMQYLTPSSVFAEASFSKATEKTPEGIALEVAEKAKRAGPRSSGRPQDPAPARDEIRKLKPL